MAPSGEEWFTIITPHFRIHHTLPLEPYARAVAQHFEHALPELEKRMNWTAPDAIDVIVEDPTDSANGLTMNYPNNEIELFASPFGADTTLAYYEDWPNEIATHELTHMVSNDTTLGFYSVMRSIFGSWVKPNGIQPVWLSEGLAVFEETSLTGAGRGRSPLLEAILREAVLRRELTNPDFASLDRFNDGVPWWPSGNTQYMLGYTIQALATRDTPNLPGLHSHQNARTIIFAPNKPLRHITGQTWPEIWAGATDRLHERYHAPAGDALNCALTKSGRFTGGQAVAADGWIYFSEEDWDRGYHLARVRSDAPCGNAEVERLDRKDYSGPSQVAVSPSGKLVAFAALDPGYETEFSDVYLWSERHGEQRLTKDERVRDPAFVNEENLLFIKANADTSQSIVQRNLKSDAETVLYTSRPLDRVSDLMAAQNRILFALHYDDGHEKIVELKNGKASPLVQRTHPTREFERNPYLAADGSIFFAAAYGSGAQEIYRIDPAGKSVRPVLRGRAGFLDRPVLTADNKLIVQSYGMNGLNLVRSAWAPLDTPTSVPAQDLHEFLSGEKPPAADEHKIDLPPSVPYSIANTGTSLWPHYWFPEVAAGQDGVLLGASTSGNDALNYHRYYGTLQWDSRARFPLYQAYYRNRVNTTNFHFEALQTNNYFTGSKTSNRNSIYSVEAIFPLWDFSVSFGTAYRQKLLDNTKTNNMLVFQNIGIDRSGATPSAIAANWGYAFNNFTALYPSSKNESTFVDVRPELYLFTRGFHPSHSISLAMAMGISTNQFVSSNYYQGGGASAISSSQFVVRGYPNDVLFGQRVATANLAYTLPLAHIYHGWSTNPYFLKTIGLRFMADAGSANHLGAYNGNNFVTYESYNLGQKILYGGGVDLITSGTIFYHIPLSLILGGHYGADRHYGGGWSAFVGLGVSIDTGTFRKLHGSHLLDSAQADPQQ